MRQDQDQYHHGGRRADVIAGQQRAGLGPMKTMNLRVNTNNNKQFLDQQAPRDAAGANARKHLPSQEAKPDKTVDQQAVFSLSPKHAYLNHQIETIPVPVHGQRWS